MPACMFATWFSSIFQNVLTSNDYTIQITGKVAESAELACAVVSWSAVSLNVRVFYGQTRWLAG